jgi:hypothetical protein
MLAKEDAKKRKLVLKLEGRILTAATEFPVWVVNAK